MRGSSVFLVTVFLASTGAAQPLQLIPSAPANSAGSDGAPVIQGQSPDPGTVRSEPLVETPAVEPPVPDDGLGRPDAVNGAATAPDEEPTGFDGDPATQDALDAARQRVDERATRILTEEDLSEMPITVVLNRLGQEGYAQLQGISRDGAIYRINAVRRDLLPVTLTYDPGSGEVTEVLR